MPKLFPGILMGIICMTVMLNDSLAQSRNMSQQATATVTATVTIANPPETYDPLERLNRSIFTFNKLLDALLIKPLTHIYQAIVPHWGRARVNSVVSNLKEPITVVNSVLQRNSHAAFHSFWRFTINSTYGIGGLFDVARVAGLPENRKDFGQTLGVYGIPAGPYIVLPIIGPSSGRDAVGKLADVFTDPFDYLLSRDALIAVYSANLINTRSELMPLTDQIDKTSLDSYATMRSLYLQSRESDVRNATSMPLIP